MHMWHKIFKMHTFHKFEIRSLDKGKRLRTDKPMCVCVLNVQLQKITPSSNAHAHIVYMPIYVDMHEHATLCCVVVNPSRRSFH